MKQALGYGEDITVLPGSLARFEDANLDLVEMVLANDDTWDRYAASQWLNVSRWLDANTEASDAHDVRRTRDASRRKYLQYERRYLGWGIFVLRTLKA